MENDKAIVCVLYPAAYSYCTGWGFCVYSGEFTDAKLSSEATLDLAWHSAALPIRAERNICSMSDTEMLNWLADNMVTFRGLPTGLVELGWHDEYNNARITVGSNLSTCIANAQNG